MTSNEVRNAILMSVWSVVMAHNSRVTPKRLAGIDRTTGAVLDGNGYPYEVSDDLYL